MPKWSIDNRYVRCTRSLDYPFDGVRLNNDTILAELLLHENDLLRPLHHKVAARVERTLRHACQLRLRPSRKHALVAPQHDRQAPYGLPPLHDRAPARVLEGDRDRRAVGNVAQTALVRGDVLLVVRLGLVAVGEADLDVHELDPEARVDVGGDLVVGLDDVLDVGVDEVVEGVNVLLDEALDLEESGEEEPFVLWGSRSARRSWCSHCVDEGELGSLCEGRSE